MPGVIEFLSNAYDMTTPSYWGNKLGHSVISEPSERLMEKQAENNVEKDDRSLTDCAVDEVVDKIDGIPNEIKSETCTSDEWKTGLAVEALERAKGVIDKTAGSTIMAGADAVTSMGEARTLHKQTIETLSKNEFPGVKTGETKIDGTRYDYHVDAAGYGESGDPDDVTVYLERSDGHPMIMDNAPDSKSFHATESALKNQAIDEVHKYQQDGGNYKDLVEQTAKGENDYLTPSAAEPPPVRTNLNTDLNNNMVFGM